MQRFRDYSLASTPKLEIGDDFLNDHGEHLRWMKRRDRNAVVLKSLILDSIYLLRIHERFHERKDAWHGIVQESMKP